MSCVHFCPVNKVSENDLKYTLTRAIIELIFLIHLLIVEMSMTISYNKRTL